MTELTEINGVGPSYAESLEDAGFESAEDVADADPDALDDLIDRADGAQLVANAVEVADEPEPVAVEDEDVTDDDEESTAEVEDDTETVEDEADEDDLIELTPNFTETQEVHLMRALVREEVRNRRTNDTDGADTTRDIIRQVRAGEPYELTLDQCDYAYRAINQLQQEYQQDRHINTLVGEIRAVTEVLQQARTDNWPQ